MKGKKKKTKGESGTWCLLNFHRVFNGLLTPDQLTPDFGSQLQSPGRVGFLVRDQQTFYLLRQKGQGTILPALQEIIILWF